MNESFAPRRYFSWLNLLVVVLVTVASTGLREMLIVQVALFAVVAGSAAAMLYTIHLSSRAGRAEVEATLGVFGQTELTPRSLTAAA